ncbi:hypothetical protein ACFYO1_29545 [Nocardia sp. NPDC006044]|uniref:hypothetical protein n=1 Tax=Nocardia sp. NPDC006044 TaxID=3364306 RepID=UPI0036C7B93E
MASLYVGHEMSEAIRLLAEASHNLVNAVIRVTTNMAEHGPHKPLRQSVDSFVGIDIDSGASAVRSFGLDSVESFPLVDRAGQVIGVKFTSHEDDIAAYEHWAGAKLRTSDSSLCIGMPDVIRHPDGDRISWAEVRPAPWDAGGQPPTYLFAHGNADGTVDIRSKSGDGTQTDVVVDGTTFGRVLAANSYYLHALEGNSLTTVSGICYGESLAEGMTEHLWEAGIETDVYSFKTAANIYSLGTSKAHAEVSTLAAVAVDPADEQHLADPITHRALRRHS